MLRDVNIYIYYHLNICDEFIGITPLNPMRIVPFYFNEFRINQQFKWWICVSYFFLE